jgi:peptide/nickel transport system permease protein
LAVTFPSMGSYLLRRLALTIPILFGISLLVFFMLHTAGGDPAQLILGARADPQSLAALRAEMGLDRPLPVQYAAFVANALRGDLGRSYRSQTPVIEEIAARFPATIELAVAAMLIAVILGAVLGTLAAVRRHTIFDYTSSAVVLLGVSIPTFWLGLILIIVFGLWLRWLPISGRINPRLGADPSAPFLTLSAIAQGNWLVAKDAALHLILPALTLAAWPAAIVARMTRASLIESLSQDYVRTARGKGLLDSTIVRRHAARNALLPVLTVVGLEFGALLGGAVVTETIFSWPGLGQLTVQAIGARDYQMVQGVVLLLATVFVLLNLLVDVLYAVLDPRIRYQ